MSPRDNPGGTELLGRTWVMAAHTCSGLVRHGIVSPCNFSALSLHPPENPADSWDQTPEQGDWPENQKPGMGPRCMTLESWGRWLNG